MKKIPLFLFAILFCIGAAGAAVRDGNTLNRAATDAAAATARTTSNAPGTNRTATATSRGAANNVTSRATTARSAANTVSRSATTRGAATQTARSAAISNVSRGGAAPKTVRSATARAATISVGESQAFGTGYNACRDAYFTCMDQFCAKQDETYRRCVCSSRLEEIKSKERALSQTAQQLEDFVGLNIDVIDKTSAEVKAMTSATIGEAAATGAKDKSASAQQLAGISSVLNQTKTKSLSTAGQLDIAGDINAIWQATDLAAGADIMNLTGEKLYNAVHAQCVGFATGNCETASTLNMVVSAYGMYIENDCTTLSTSLAQKTVQASGAIRETEREMNTARLENYDAHNSSSINDCIASVRKDITTNTACGTDYVHCLDITGKYLNYDTGEPIYTADFYQLELQTSLAGDVLSNQANRMLVAELNRKKEFAKVSLDKCRDLSYNVWEEFMRQAITEIYQGQHERIRQVKNECVDVVNNCYDTQSKSLKDFSNVKEQLLLGARLELSADMCNEKLSACRNLYGVETSEQLQNIMDSITDQKIAKECKATLQEYARDICMVPSSDIVHGYPFGCRTYVPGEQKYALVHTCNAMTTNTGAAAGLGQDDNEADATNNYTHYYCPLARQYNSCNPGYYMVNRSHIYDPVPAPGNDCAPCGSGFFCPGGTANRQVVVDGEPETNECGDYAGSLYQMIARYALQVCVRPSSTTRILEGLEPFPTTVLTDVNVVMDTIRADMGKELAKECERLGGVWVDRPGDGVDSDKIYPLFDSETSANRKWGYCANPTTTTTPPVAPVGANVTEP